MFVQFSVKGEYEDYFGMKLTEEELHNKTSLLLSPYSVFASVTS